MIRAIGGAAAGIAIAIVLMMIVEGIGNQLFPAPTVDLNSPASPAALPVANQLLPIFGWFIATLIGGWLAVRISGHDWMAWVVAASVLVGQLTDYLLGRHEAWIMAAGVIAPILGAWLAPRLPGRSLRPSE